MNEKEYHVLSLSGGKDSTALAFFIRDNLPEIHEKIEYVFCDTECELPEIYEYLDKIEVFLNKPVKRLKPYQSFDNLYEFYNFLPSVSRRWCTYELKTKVFRKYMYDKFQKNGEKTANLYIGIRADEANRATDDKSDGKNIKAHFPFVENALNRKDIDNILKKNGIGLPDFYKWRKRSGCYFCFFQSKNDWLNLYENQPELFKKAMSYEKKYNDEGKFNRFGWNSDLPLEDMLKPKNIKKIRENYKKLQERKAAKQSLEKNSNTLFEIEDENENTCIFCHI